MNPHFFSCKPPEEDFLQPDFKSCGGQPAEAFSCLAEQAEPVQPHPVGGPCSVARLVITHAVLPVIAKVTANTSEL